MLRHETQLALLLLLPAPVAAAAGGAGRPAIGGGHSAAHPGAIAAQAESPTPEARLRRLEQRLQELELRAMDLERVAPKEFEVLHYNVLAERYGCNMQPWFLYGAQVTPEERAELLRRFYGTATSNLGPSANKLLDDKGWPEWAEGVLSAERRAAIEQYHERSFRWDIRRERLWDTVSSSTADIITLAECDNFESFWSDRFRSHGFGCTWRKRPRDSAPDGSAIAWRASTFELLASGGFDFGSSQESSPDRTCCFVLLAWKRDPSQRLIIATTHLARIAATLEEEREEQLFVRGFQCAAACGPRAPLPTQIRCGARSSPPPHSLAAPPALRARAGTAPSSESSSRSRVRTTPRRSPWCSRATSTPRTATSWRAWRARW